MNESPSVLEAVVFGLQTKYSPILAVVVVAVVIATAAVQVL